MATFELIVIMGAMPRARDIAVIRLRPAAIIDAIYRPTTYPPKTPFVEDQDDDHRD